MSESIDTQNSEAIEKLLSEDVWSYGCKKCGTSGTTEGNVECTSCKGLGMNEWQYVKDLES